MKTLAGKGDALLVQTDISDPDSAQACVDKTVEAFGTVDILVNNAALYYDIDNFDPSFDYLKKVFAVNQFGAWLMVRAAAPVMAKQRYGRVVNQSSGAAYAYSFPTFGDEFTGLGNYSYSITKWGIVGLTKFMAAQLGVWNITVNCIAPGVTMTEATKKIVPDFFIEGMTAQTAMKSTLEPEDLAGRVRVLRERRRQVRHRPDSGHRRRPGDARLGRLGAGLARSLDADRPALDRQQVVVSHHRDRQCRESLGDEPVELPRNDLHHDEEHDRFAGVHRHAAHRARQLRQSRLARVAVEAECGRDDRAVR